MIIYINSSGTENTIRNDDIAKDLFKRGNIKADTLVKTSIHGEWKRADSLELFSSLIELKDEKDISSSNAEEISTLKEEVIESSTKTGGGLELAETHREDIRYRKAKIISSGPDNLEEGQTIMFDRVAGFPVEFDEKIYKVINIRDVVAII